MPSAGAESIFRPAGLTPGDEYRLAFVTAGKRNAVENTDTDPTLAGANGVPVYLLDGRTRIADDYDNLWDGDSWGQTILLAPLRLTQYGVPSPSGGNDV